MKKTLKTKSVVGLTKIKTAKDGSYYGMVTFGRNSDKESMHKYHTRRCKTPVSAKRYCKIFCDNMKISMSLK